MSNDFLYWFGFYVEYRLLCLARGLAAFTRWFARVLGALLTAVLVQLTGTLTTITVQQTLYGKQKDGQTS